MRSRWASFIWVLLVALVGAGVLVGGAALVQRQGASVVAGLTTDGRNIAVLVDDDGNVQTEIGGGTTVAILCNGVPCATEATVNAIKNAVESTDPVSVIPVGGTMIQGVVVTPMTLTSSTPVITGTALNYQYITRCTVSNAHGTVGTDIYLQDGVSGTTLDVIPAPAAGTTNVNGAVVNYASPLKIPTLGNGLAAVNVTTGSSTKISCNGWRSTASY